MKFLIFIFLLCPALFVAAQQKFFTKTARFSLYSHAPLETIEALNGTGAIVLDAKNGTVQSAVLMRGFEFKKALMQEHFNENYVESDRYPKAEFKGVLVNGTGIDYSKDGTYNAMAKGQLTLHGITKPLEVPVALVVQNGKLRANSTFTLLLSDYHVSIPSIVKNKVSNTVRITIEASLEPLK